jgi:hypothetical protein
MAQPRGLRGIAALGTRLAISTSKASITHARRDTMKFENLMLQGFFAAGLLVCVLVLGGMLTTHTSAPAAVAAHAAVVASR